MQQLVSVIIPCYNSSLTIQRAITSVLVQTYHNIELVIVDDASVDFEMLSEIVIKFNDNRIKLFRHEINKNGSAARNTGIINAKGDYIAFLDSDDEWFPEHLEKSIVQFKKGYSENYIVYCKNLVKTTNNDDLIMPAVGIGLSEKVSNYLFCNNGYMSTPSLFGSAATFKKNLFDETLIRHQDYELLLRLDAGGFRFSLADHIGVIVHWENNDTGKKGGTPQFSLDFVRKNKVFFTAKSYTCFVLKNVIFPIFIKKERMKGLKIFLSDCNPFYISLKNWFFCFDYFFWGRLNLVKLFVGK